MEYNRPIAQMCPGDQIEGFYVLKSAMLKTSANGKSFLNAVLSDRDSAVAAKVWDYPGPISTAEEGKVVKIRGTVSEYRGDLQVVIDRIRLAEESDPVDLSLLVPVAPIDVEKTFEEVERLVASIQDKDLRAVCQIMLERHAQALRTIPAAKSVHHGFVSGLLMHTADMLRLADFLAAQYAAIVDRSLLLAGTLLHDFAKEQEFVRSELGLVTDYSVKGQLLGHLVLGAQEVARVAEEVGMPEERSLLLQHIDPSPTTESRSSAQPCGPSARRASCSAASTASTAAWRSTGRRSRRSLWGLSADGSSRWRSGSTTMAEKNASRGVFSGAVCQY